MSVVVASLKISYKKELLDQQQYYSMLSSFERLDEYDILHRTIDSASTTTAPLD